jgi:PEP-CTERM motif
MNQPIPAAFSMAIACAAMAILPAQALTLQSPDCTASTITQLQPGYVSCLGSYVGNMDNQLTGVDGIFTAINTHFNLNTSTYFSSDNFNASGNPFSQNEGSLDDGVIDFDNSQTGTFVLGLKQGSGFSLYLFNAANVLGGIGSLRYDTNGVQPNNGIALSHAGFFGSATATPIPEPETYAMVLIGLGLLGLATRREKTIKLT